MPALYTDGSCLKNPGGPGGWAFLLLDGEKEWYSCAGNPRTTNNQMELMAVVMGLTFYKGCECEIYTDSQYVMKCAKGEYKRHKNLELWKEYDKVSAGRCLEWHWVKGHSGDEYNEQVDKLARECAYEARPRKRGTTRYN
jgi:ribonuclease HI